MVDPTDAPRPIPIDRQRVDANAADIHWLEGPDVRLDAMFHPSEWPHVLFRAPLPWDWSQAGAFAITLRNPGTKEVSFGIRIDDDLAADGIHHCRTAQGTVAAGESARFSLAFGPDPMSVGMRALPPRRGYHNLVVGGEGAFDRSHIVQFQVFLHRPAEPTRLVIADPNLLPPVSVNGIVDAFGQFTGATWPGKAHGDEDLHRQRQEEAAALKQHPLLPERDQFAGWSTGPQLRGTGFFRTEKVDGRWWLIDPEGHLFFSNGVDTVIPGDSTFITGREKMFTWLPTQSDPLTRFYSNENFVHSGPIHAGRVYDFYGANLERKYGRDWDGEWHSVTLERMRSWGFNTLGNWSDWSYYRNGRVPYVATAGVGGKHARVSSGSDYWGTMHDPFDPQFDLDARASITPALEKVKGDPWCLGVFVDNELSWGGGGPDGGRYGLAIGALTAARDSPVRAALIRQLQAKYTTIDALNAAWNRHFVSWHALEEPYRPPEPYTDSMKRDFAAFVLEFARRYFQGVRNAVRAADPDHLYLGCRFAWKTPEAIQAASELCDVISFNVYERELDRARWKDVEARDRPCIIGEFHFGALDRGMFHPGLVAAANQQQRAAMYRHYVESVADSPVFVGCHWFEYIDEPLTGRSFDGENYNIGLVSVTDTPYPEMVAAARDVHRRIYARHAAAVKQ